MNRNVFKALTLSLIFVLSACGQTPPAEPQRVNTNPNYTTGYYSFQLVDELMATANNVRPGERVAVTSPVWLAGGLRESNLMGLQLQQELSAELHAVNLQVVEFKLTNAIRVTPEGDFALSTNYLELNETFDVDYVLVGTLLDRGSSMVVTLRMLDFGTRVVKATAQIEIPRDVVRDMVYTRGTSIVN
ncbi:MAG: hypothetical protein HLUCCO02_09220 [Idiomarinaceae bacterium HL-53]|nr:MAG: hypothetical protein HLUCCO02_09220 [Idiomarinaceae bacterium HL-53]CUS47711.1 hypothetical protein Ga0003345_0644 [Idiomarinaceae bacterium HL-53]